MFYSVVVGTDRQKWSVKDMENFTNMVDKLDLMGTHPKITDIFSL